MTRAPASSEQFDRVRALAASAKWSEAAALLDASAPEEQLPADVVLLRGELMLRTGETSRACTWAASALQMAHVRRHAAATRAMWNQLGVARFTLGLLDDAEVAFAQASALARRDGDELLVARVSNNVGTIENVRGRYDLAIGQYRLAIPAYERIGHARGLAETYHNLALTARHQRQLDAAEEFERKALEFARLAGDVVLRVMGEIGLAETALLRGDFMLAERLSERAARNCARRHDRANHTDALRIAGAACRAQGKLRHALGLLTRAIALARDGAAPLLEAEARWERAQVHDDEENVTAARDDAEHALVLFERLGAAVAREIRAWLDAPDRAGGVGNS